MENDIKIAKLMNGEIVIGKRDKETGNFNDVIAVRIMPSGDQVQTALVPYLGPVSRDLVNIEKNWIITYCNAETDLTKKYEEVVIKVNTGIVTASPADLSKLTNVRPMK